MPELPIFKVAQIKKWVAPLERARKTGSENAMICYVSMKTFRDTRDRKSAKTLINCWISIFIRFSILRISNSFHRNIVNHTIFCTSFSSSFQWCYSLFNLSNFKNWYFWHIRGLTLGVNVTSRWGDPLNRSKVDLPIFWFGTCPRSFKVIFML